MDHLLKHSHLRNRAQQLFNSAETLCNGILGQKTMAEGELQGDLEAQRIHFKLQSECYYLCNPKLVKAVKTSISALRNRGLLKQKH